MILLLGSDQNTQIIGDDRQVYVYWGPRRVGMGILLVNDEDARKLM